MAIRRWGDVQTMGVIDDNALWDGNRKGFDIAGLAGGGYVVAGIDSDLTPFRAYFQIFDANGTAETGRIEINPSIGSGLGGLGFGV